MQGAKFTLRQARQYCGKTQQEMADSIGVCRSTYIEIEKNPDTATIRQAKKISEVTGISIENIFFDSSSTFSRAMGEAN